jgi:hypothetical protein
MFIFMQVHSKTSLPSFDRNPEFPWLHMIANIIPVLNGRDSNGNSIRLGPHTTKIHKYLLVIFVAQSLQIFRLTYGEKIDKSSYFTLHGLGQGADKFKQFGPYHQPIHYDRTKVAGRIYSIFLMMD